MKEDKTKVPTLASQALVILQNCFGNSLLAVYLHGSAVAGGLRPNSDVDLLVIIDQPTTHAVRERLVKELMRVSGRYPASQGDPRPLELMVFQRADLSALDHPARSEFRSEFVYGEWLRGDFEAGVIPAPVSDPELTLLLAQARHNAIALIGPPATTWLPAIQKADIRRAISDTLPILLASLEGDERNVLLTLARMWRMLVEGDFVPKDVAAKWAIPRLPDEVADLLDYARIAYLSRNNDDWSDRRQDARQLANIMGRHVKAILSSHMNCSTMSTFKIVQPKPSDIEKIAELYTKVAEIEGGLARAKNEITLEYIRHNFEQSQLRGVSLIAVENDVVVGELHAYSPYPKVFSHVLSDLTIAIHPDFQGKGIGKSLFFEFINHVVKHMPHIMRIELIARESNKKAIRLYESLN